jgi:hypothetical protein
VILFLITLMSISATAKDFNYRHSSEMTSSDYLFKERSNLNDSVFDNYQTIELGFNLGIGADCGKVDFKSTLQGTLKNLLDAKYFESVGNNISRSKPDAPHLLLQSYLVLHSQTHKGQCQLPLTNASGSMCAY